MRSNSGVPMRSLLSVLLGFAGLGTSMCRQLNAVRRLDSPIKSPIHAGRNSNQRTLRKRARWRGAKACSGKGSRG